MEQFQLPAEKNVRSARKTFEERFRENTDFNRLLLLCGIVGFVLVFVTQSRRPRSPVGAAALVFAVGYIVRYVYLKASKILDRQYLAKYGKSRPASEDWKMPS